VKSITYPQQERKYQINFTIFS